MSEFKKIYRFMTDPY